MPSQQLIKLTSYITDFDTATIKLKTEKFLKSATERDAILAGNGKLALQVARLKKDFNRGIEALECFIKLIAYADTKHDLILKADALTRFACALTDVYNLAAEKPEHLIKFDQTIQQNIVDIDALNTLKAKLYEQALENLNFNIPHEYPEAFYNALLGKANQLKIDGNLEKAYVLIETHLNNSTSPLSMNYCAFENRALSYIAEASKERPNIRKMSIALRHANEQLKIIEEKSADDKNLNQITTLNINIVDKLKKVPCVELRREFYNILIKNSFHGLEESNRLLPNSEQVVAAI